MISFPSVLSKLLNSAKYSISNPSVLSSICTCQRKTRVQIKQSKYIFQFTKSKNKTRNACRVYLLPQPQSPLTKPVSPAGLARLATSSLSSRDGNLTRFCARSKNKGLHGTYNTRIKYSVSSIVSSIVYQI